MNLAQLERLCSLLATREHTPQLRYIAKSTGDLKSGYYLDDLYIGTSRNRAFSKLCELIQERMQMEIRDFPASQVSTRRGRG